jgi:hypothetical protein
MSTGFERIRKAQAEKARAEAEITDTYRDLARTIGNAEVSFEVNEGEIIVTVASSDTHAGSRPQDKISLSLKNMADVARYILEVARTEEESGA